VRWTDEAILEALLAYLSGRPPRPADLDERCEDRPSLAVVVLRFGSWERAMVAGGLGGG